MTLDSRINSSQVRTNFNFIKQQFSAAAIRSSSSSPIATTATSDSFAETKQGSPPIMSIPILLLILTQLLLPIDCLPSESASQHKQATKLSSSGPGSWFHYRDQEAPSKARGPSTPLRLGGGGRDGEDLERVSSSGAGYTLAFEEASQDKRGSLVRKLLLDNPTDRNQELVRRLTNRQLDYQILYPANLDNAEAPETRGHRDNRDASRGDSDEPRDSSLSRLQPSVHSLGTGNRPTKANQILGHYNRTNVVIKAFNYKFRLDLELNENLFGPSLMQKHFLPRGNQQISTQKIEHCYYHARTQPEAKPSAIGAFRTCNGLSGIIHANNESFIIHPFYEVELNKKHPHIIYRYQTSIEPKSQPDTQGGSTNQLPVTNETTSADEQQQQQQQTIKRECGNTRLHEWALRQYNKVNTPSKRTVNNTKARFSKRDVSLTEKYIELALILSQDVFDKRNSSSRLEVLQDAIQIINCLDLYFRSANTRVALIYIETWAHGDQIDISADVKQTLYNFLEYSTRKLYKVSMDAVHLITGGHLKQFDSNEVGMSIPDSICTSRAVSVSQEASVFEPFIAASTIAHMLGHNLGMEHDHSLGNDNGNNQQRQQQPRVVPVNTDLGRSQIGSLRLPAINLHQPTASISGSINPKNQHHQQRNQQQQHQDQEDHEDEIKSRSLSYDEVQQELTESAISGEDPSGSGIQQQQQHCHVNCLMNERFTYVLPPVSFGNMVQQQVATAAGPTAPNQSLISTLGIFHDITNNNNNNQVASTIDQKQQQHYLNGITMNQIDNELNNDHRQQQQPFTTTSLPFGFSRQSLDTYHRLLRYGHGICLFNKPNQLEDFKTCGNGIVDKGEDCDCGSIQECFESDSCCDPITCRFKADAECINGACCDRCKLRARGFVCRKSRGECDLAEMCDGKSSHCGPDVHKQNGYPCLMNHGYCYLGQCPVPDQQCSELWGSDARKSDRLCYTNFNLNGTIRGNCGYDANLRKYKRCEHEHMMCGTLQCQLGDMKPVTAPIDSASGSPNSGSSLATTGSKMVSTAAAAATHEFSKKTLHALDGAHHECKVITGLTTTSAGNGAASGHGPTAPNQLSSISYIRDGSKCQANKVCFNFTCQPLEIVYKETYELCPRDERARYCSGNGICSTAHRCHCEAGWMGHDCSQRELPPPPSPPPNASPAQANSSQTMLLQPDPIGGGQMLPPRSGVAEPVGGLIDGASAQEQTLMASNRLPPTERNIVITGPGSGAPLGPSPPLAPRFGQDLGLATTEATTILKPSSVSTTGNQPATTTAPPTPAPPPPPVTPSTVHQDKKKHDAMGAPTLVFILVTIVAAVYLGFALMANCYRRKGFLKPDKVLRHHQMNCKLDAIRSSFIAKRLADAAGEVCCMDDVDQPNILSSSRDLDANLMPNPFGLAPQPQPVLCQHIAGSAYGLEADSQNGEMPPPPLPGVGGGGYGQVPTTSKQLLGPGGGDFANHPVYTAANTGQKQLHQAPARPIGGPQQFSASVHYFDEQAQQERKCHHRHHHQAPILRSFNGGAHRYHQTDQWLADNTSRSHTLTRITRRPAPHPPPGHENMQQWHQHHQHHHHHPFGGHYSHHLPTATSINRATSLGNVNGSAGHQAKATRNLLSRLQRNSNNEDFERVCADDEDENDNEDTRRVITMHRALATPSRAVAAPRTSGLFAGPTYYRRSPVEDSCSAPSSPEHRAPYWDDADRQQRQRRGNLSRQSSSVSRQNHLAQQQQPTGYHEEAIMSALGGSQRHLVEPVAASGDDGGIGGGGEGRDEGDLPPLPPPPLPSSSSSAAAAAAVAADHLLESGCNEPEETEDSGEDESHARGQYCGTSTHKRKSEPTLTQSPIISSAGWSMRTVKRIPLNSDDSDEVQLPEQVSLIAQLQQLERVQSLHQKQVSLSTSTTASGGDKQASRQANLAPSEGLHEFFSLPLSVQLSALLTRSLQSCDNGRGEAGQIEDYLNVLNNTNVAASEHRRGFGNKNWSTIGGGSSNQAKQQQHQSSKDQQQQQAGSWSGTNNKRQQIKLHLLEGLITRLQKLHSQTIQQQQLGELNGVEMDDGDLGASSS